MQFWLCEDVFCRVCGCYDGFYAVFVFDNPVFAVGDVGFHCQKAGLA